TCHGLPLVSGSRPRLRPRLAWWGCGTEWAAETSCGPWLSSSAAGDVPVFLYSCILYLAVDRAAILVEPQSPNPCRICTCVMPVGDALRRACKQLAPFVEGESSGLP